MRFNLRKVSGFMASVMLAAAIIPGPAALAKATGGNQAMGTVENQAYDEELFGIRVVDAETGRGIPAVELRTVNNIRFYTDSAGYVAFDEPGLMNETVFFHISSHGYEVPTDMFGYRGQAVNVTPGGSVTIEMKRINLAERLYRVTGQGIYRDSVLLGETAPIEEPILNGKVMGQDSVQTIAYKNKLYWFWGDTDRVAYPLGNFRVTGATSKLPSGGLDLDVGVDLDYITREDGFVKSLVPPLPDGAGIAWIFGLMTVEDETGEERLLAAYSTHKPEPNAFGILIWNDDKQEFEQLVQFPGTNDWRYAGMGGQATYYEDGGKGYYTFTQHTYPNLRVEAKLDAIIDHTQYESFTPLVPGTSYNGADTQLERDADGKLVWDWKKNTQMLTQDQEKELIRLGVIKPGDERYFQLKDADSGDEVRLAQSSVEWNEYRQSYVMIGQEKFGRTSLLGELWFSEAPAPNGPWRLAKKVITHNEYSFYNPSQHEYFIKDNGRYLYFEATYTNTFTDAPATPRYNYNQMMYKLDLSSPELDLTPSAGPELTELAGGKSIMSSTNEDGRPAANANDGNGETRWASASSDPQWIQVDLGAPYLVSRVQLDWEAAYGRAYELQVSNDGESWTGVYSTTTGDGGTDTVKFEETEARYVRMLGTSRGTMYGYSLWEFKVFGREAGEEEPAVSLTGPSAVDAGQSFDLTYGLDPMKQSVYAEDVTFAYNAEQLQFVSATEAAEQVEIAGQTNSQGRVRLLLVHFDGIARGDIVTLRFTSKTTGETVTATVSVADAILANGEGGELALGGASHSIQITAKARTGDLNEDGRYSVGDLAIISAAYGKTSDDANWALYSKADLNRNGKIDIEDLAAMARKIVGEG
ncbi:discoidin domain-containing protein [Paenibacillus nanensis]|uniref:discoidin domain-containing protein n=1 Tax=Paenibacillus nanensis TaxID=393251 RepID=UPI0013C33D5F|nr:discoidin domain-containing protein [Paenibacillus nanensis]